MASFKEGDFVYHSFAEKGYGFVLKVDDENDYYVWHMVSEINPRRDVERFLTLARRDPTDEELAAFVAWRLTC